ncbi:hypothetical protein DOTSEDRAFT_53817 [Dothistroma septosporum NZE10]|uniref:Uncharacterized protein n=1 Tax=Dothistroma septosporum (strain NZE10 / CBS 128990) TaxID=675120 RepID=M2XJZ7_DOTSN|nr:hypothetical protein DOTSEDRAFT_53817 [Dothistroma septosporum NZE10]
MPQHMTPVQALSIYFSHLTPSPSIYSSCSTYSTPLTPPARSHSSRTMPRKRLASPSSWTYSHCAATYTFQDFSDFLREHSGLSQRWPEKDHEHRQELAKTAAECLWTAGTPICVRTCQAIMLSLYALDEPRTHKNPWTNRTPKTQRQHFTWPRKSAARGPYSDQESDNASNSPSPSRPITPLISINGDDNDNYTQPRTPIADDHQLLTPDPTPVKQHTSGFNPDTFDTMTNAKLQAKQDMRKMFDDLQGPIDKGQAELNGTPLDDAGRKRAERRLASLQALQDRFRT